MRILLVLSALALGACQSSFPPRTGATMSRIQAEMAEAEAIQSKQAQQAIEQAMLPKAPLDDAASAAKTDPRFDLAVNEAPVGQVLTAIVSGTRYSMLVPPEVSGRITVNLKNVTVREALEAIRELYGYDFKVQGNRIVVQPNTMQTRVFQINYLASKRLGTSELAISSGSLLNAAPSASTPTAGAAGSASGGGSTQGQAASRVQTSSDVDFWSNLETALTALVASSGAPAAGAAASAETPGIVLNKMSGVVVVRAMPREMRLIENYLRVTQIVVERQVMLEAKIMEVTLSQSHQAGVNWGAFRSGNNSAFNGGVTGPNSVLRPLDANGLAQTMTDNLANTVLPGLAGSVTTGSKGLVGLAFQTANFAMLLNFLETQGAVEVLSSPRIATLNNQKAVLKVGTDETFITGFTVTASTTTTGGVSSAAAVPTPTTATLFSGISLDVMPQIDESGQIVLHIHPAVSKVTTNERSFNLGAGGNITLPLASRSVNESDSIVRVKDGQIVAIGGLMTQDQTADRSGLPGTTQSSWGTLAGQRSNALQKRELVILIKPTVIDSASAARDVAATSARFRHFDLDPASRENVR